jgi:hypothetical protein
MFVDIAISVTGKSQRGARTQVPRRIGSTYGADREHPRYLSPKLALSGGCMGINTIGDMIRKLQISLITDTQLGNANWTLFWSPVDQAQQSLIAGGGLSPHVPQPSTPTFYAPPAVCLSFFCPKPRGSRGRFRSRSEVVFVVVAVPVVEKDLG